MSPYSLNSDKTPCMRGYGQTHSWMSIKLSTGIIGTKAAVRRRILTNREEGKTRTAVKNGV